MNKTLLVLRHEMLSNVARRSWLLITFLPTVLLLVVVLVAPLLRGTSLPSAGPSPAPGSPGAELEGYVDESGLVRFLPEDVKGKLLAYPDEASARRALEAKEIAAYFVVPADYLQTGDLIYIDPDFTAFEPEGQSWMMRWTLLLNLLDGDAVLAQQVRYPVDLKVTALAPSDEREVELGARYWITYGLTMVLYVSILMSSSLLRNSMGNERKNRTMETLLLSVGPRQLLAGKIVGLAILGVLQTAVWVGGAYLGLGLGGQALNLPPDFHLSVATVFWAVVFSLLGYAVYASLLAGLGALSGPNAMGSSTADFVVIWPLIIPLFFLVFLIQYPNGTLAVALSLFPLTAPVAMVTRLAGGGIPLWQPVLGAALLVGTAFFVLRAVARVFQAQYLLSGQDLSFKGYLSVLLGRASGRGA